MDLAARMWRKSSLSGTESDCVEVALTENIGAIRDSKNPAHVLTVDVRTFVAQAKASRLDG